MSELDEVLNGEDVDETPEQQQVEDSIQASPDEVETEQPTGEKEVSPPDTGNDQIEAFKASMMDERRKRQELEEQLKSYQQQSQPKPDFWENPEGVLGDYAKRMQQQLYQTQVNLSTEMMRTMHDDYDEMESKFIELAQQNPALIAQMNQSGNPAKFAYTTAKAEVERQQFADPNYKEKLKAELRAEIEAEQRAKLEGEISKRASLPGTLSSERATGGKHSAGHDSLSDLLGR